MNIQMLLKNVYVFPFIKKVASREAILFPIEHLFTASIFPAGKSRCCVLQLRDVNAAANPSSR